MRYTLVTSWSEITALHHVPSISTTEPASATAEPAATPAESAASPSSKTSSTLDLLPNQGEGVLAGLGNLYSYLIALL